MMMDEETYSNITKLSFGTFSFTKFLSRSISPDNCLFFHRRFTARILLVDCSVEDNKVLGSYTLSLYCMLLNSPNATLISFSMTRSL